MNSTDFHPGPNRVLCLATALVIAALAYAAEPALALPAYLTSFEQRYPAAVGTRIDACGLCHTAAIPELNPYGMAFQGSGHDFAAIEAEDSDGDGFSNLAEIMALTFPGDPADFPAPVDTPTETPVAETATPTSTPLAFTPTATPSGALIETPTATPSGALIQTPTATPSGSLVQTPTNTSGAGTATPTRTGGSPGTTPTPTPSRGSATGSPTTSAARTATSAVSPTRSAARTA